MGPTQRTPLTVVPASQSGLPVPRRRTLGLVSVEPGFVDVVEAFCSLRILEAWAELRLLLRDDARLESIAARGVVGPEATIEAMRFAAAGNAYSVRDFDIEPVGDNAALLRASISHEEQAVGVVTSIRWLVTGREGRIWRSRIVATREEADRLLLEEGPGLGF
jgi:hypothetical protein